MVSDEAREERIRRLEQRLQELEARLTAVESGQGPGAPPPVPTPHPAYGAPPPGPMEQRQYDQGAWRPATAPAPAQRPARSLEEILGADLLPKAGIIVLVLGVVFLLRFAIDQGWIGPAARILLGIAGGFALAGTGDWLRGSARFGRTYPAILTGGGAAIAYVATFVGYVDADYRAAIGWSPDVAGITLGLVALATAAYGVWRDQEVMASTAGVLIALTALALEAETDWSVAYLVAATFLLLAVATWRRWVWTPFVLVVPTHAALFGLYLLDASDTVLLIAGGALLAGFTANALMPSREHPYAYAARLGTAFGSFALSWPLAMSALEADLPMDQHAYVTAGYALAAGALAAFARTAPDASRLGWLSAAVPLALVWAPLQFDGGNTVVAWSVLLLAGAFAMTRTSSWVAWSAALAAGILMVGHLLIWETGELDHGDLTRAAALLPFGAAFVSMAVAWTMLHLRGSGEAPVVRALLGLALVVPLVYITAAFDGSRITIGWALEGAILVGLGFGFRIVDLRYASFAVFGLVLGRLFIVDVQGLDPALRIVTFLVVGALVLGVGALFARRRRPPKVYDTTSTA